MSDIAVDIVTPEKLAFSGRVAEARVPGENGEFGVLPGHTILLSLVRPGVVTLVGTEGPNRFVVGKGFAEAGPERVVILVDSCEPAESVDKVAAQKAKDDALRVLETEPFGSDHYLTAQRELALADARLSV